MQLYLNRPVLRTRYRTDNYTVIKEQVFFEKGFDTESMFCVADMLMHTNDKCEYPLSLISCEEICDSDYSSRQCLL